MKRILDAARRIMDADGYEAATVRRIAEAAGLAPSSVIEHFPRKLDILLAIADEDHISRRDIVEKVLERSKGESPATVIGRAMNEIAAFDYSSLRRVSDTIAASFTWSQADQARFTTLARQTAAPLIDYIRTCQVAGKFRNDVNARVALEALIGSQLLHLQDAGARGWSLEQFLEKFDTPLRIWLDGMRPEDDATSNGVR